MLDLQTHSWSVLRYEGEFPRGTVGHATAVQDGKIYVFGGFDAAGSLKAGAGATEQQKSRSPSEVYQNALHALDCSDPHHLRWDAIVCDPHDAEKGGAALLPTARRDHTLSAVRATQCA